MTGFIESRQSSTPPSPLLELFHPRGACERVASADLLTTEKAQPRNCEYDWMTFDGPPARPRDDRGWLRSAMACAAASLDRDGVLWLTLPRRLRPWVSGAALGAGLEVKGTYAQFADADGLKTVIPLHLLRGLEMASLSGRHLRMRQLAARALAAPGALRLFRALYPSVAFAIGRPGARPLFDWLLPVDDVAENRSAVLLRRSWHRPDLVLAHIFGGDPSALTAIAKIPISAQGLSYLRVQEELLRLVAQPAAGWGVETPRTVIRHPISRPVLISRAISGNLAAGVLARRPSEFRTLTHKLTRWLTGWNHATKASSCDRAARDLVSAASVLEPHLLRGRDYFAWLQGMLSQEAAIPYVASHGDLTMWNVVVSGKGLGILDWEEGRASDLPLGDLFYGLADALAATRSYRDRLAAFNSCFFGSERQETTPLIDGLARHLGLSARAVEISFHLCWLRHAGNEVRRDPSGPAGPFLQIVRQISSARPFATIRSGAPFD